MYFVYTEIEIKTIATVNNKNKNKKYVRGAFPQFNERRADALPSHTSILVYKGSYYYHICVCNVSSIICEMVNTYSKTMDKPNKQNVYTRTHTNVDRYGSKRCCIYAI